MRTEYCGLVNRAHLGRAVTLCGWVHRRRDHGGVIFIDLRDREGLVQVVCDPDTPETFKIADRLRSEFVIRIEGKVRARPAGTVNAELASGEVEVLAQTITILNPSLPPAFQIDDEHLSETVRLEQRVLDLRRPVMQNNLRLRYRTAMSVRSFLDGLFQRGMLAGVSAADAYSVQCDERNNPPEEAEAGRIICEIGVRPPWPAEFVVVRIGKTQSGIEVLEERSLPRG